jgi:O-6-methylguanine DNA methyltransferase
LVYASAHAAELAGANRSDESGAWLEAAHDSPAAYAALAARVGNPKAIHAVASACAPNAIALAIPCHRVIRSDGTLSGYRWETGAYC